MSLTRLVLRPVLRNSRSLRLSMKMVSMRMNCFWMRFDSRMSTTMNMPSPSNTPVRCECTLER